MTLLPWFSSPVTQLQGPSLLMDLIRALRATLHPLVEQTSFHLSDVAPLDVDIEQRFGFLEYRGTLADGRTVLLGFYQLADRRTITAEMWAPDDAIRRLPDVTVGAAALHRRVWLYSPIVEAQALTRIIYAEVTTWLQPGNQMTVRDPEAPCAEA